MIEYIEEFNKYLLLAGFSSVQIRDVDQFLESIRRGSKNVAIQVFDASLIAGRKHLYFAVLNALKAFRNGTSISKDLVVECLLYASAQRQIRLAVELLGIKLNSSNVAVVVLADMENLVKDAFSELEILISGRRDDRILEFSDKKKTRIRKLFGITDTELESRNVYENAAKAISELVIEHMALLVTHR